MYEDERIPIQYFGAHVLHNPWIDNVFRSYECNWMSLKIYISGKIDQFFPHKVAPTIIIK